MNHGLLYQSEQPQQNAASALTQVIQSQPCLRGADLVHFVRQWREPDQSLAHVNFTDVDLSECHAAHICFSHSDFTRAQLRSANLRDSVFLECVFSGTILDAANMHGCDLTGSMIVENMLPAQQRHHMRPALDELLPWHRVMARAVDLDSACLDSCLITNVDFTAAMLENASMKQCLIEKCTFESAVLTGAHVQDSHVYRSDLTTNTLAHAHTQGSVFRSNEYVPMPSVKVMLESGAHFPKLMWQYVKSEWQHWKMMPSEVKLDYRRQLWLRVLVLSTVPVLAVLAWKIMETHALIGMISAVGAVSTFALRRYFTMGLQSLMNFTWGKVNDAEGLWKSGVRGKALLSAMCKGMVLTQIHNQRRGSP